MNVRTRLYNRVVTLIIVTVAAFAGVAATHLWDLAHRSSASVASVTPAPQHQTAGYNDGWLDGQADVADQLGHRLPNDHEYALWVAEDKQTGKCHLTWSGSTTQVYRVTCRK